MVLSMSDSGPGGQVLVAVESPEHVQQLVRTAGDIASVRDGTVRIVTVVVKPYDSPFGVFDDETILREFADDSRELVELATAPEGVTVVRDLVVARSVSKGILAAVEETDPAALVVGWQGRTNRSDAVLGTTVDTLVERAGCDLYVERIGAEANGVESVLLPVAGGPHVETAAAAAKAIAVRNDASVRVLSVSTGDEDDDASQFVADGARAVAGAPGRDVPTESTVRRADDVFEAVREAAADHDIVVFGATRQGPLRRRLVGSVPRRVVDETEATVVIARAGAAVTHPLNRLGEFVRR
jgi:nucleotide-binding universal stress UspA family protein